MKILISGFEPFGGMKHNPSEALIQKIPENFNGHSLKGVVLPVSFRSGFALIREHIEEDQPDVLIAFGLANQRKEITPEKLAVNWMDASIPDNEGHQPRQIKIDMNGPDGIFSTLPVEVFVSALKDEGIPVSLSLTAGSYVCNHVMYKTLQWALEQERSLKAGFVHLPPDLHEDTLMKAFFIMIASLDGEKS